MSSKQEEVLALQQELVQVKVAQEKASREAQETRGLWEAEVRQWVWLGAWLDLCTGLCR